MSRNRTNEIIVGPSRADVVGEDGRAIQIAIDAMSARGGGTVELLAGRYVLDDAVRLAANITLRGSGRDTTFLVRSPLVWSKLAIDADISEKQITPASDASFRPGMGVILHDNRTLWTYEKPPKRITSIQSGVLHLDDYLTEERAAEPGGVVVNYFPMILCHCADNVTVEGMTVDAAVEDPDGVLAGMNRAQVLAFRSKNMTVRDMVVCNGQGDGVCFSKSSIDAVIEDCELHHNDFHGVHPGSHSAGTIVRRCEIHHNGSDGVYICWGIRNGVFEDNHIHHNGITKFRSGISIGHKDTDNLLARNNIHDNAKYGICVRQKTEANGAHRNVFRENVIENNGSRADEYADIKASISPEEAIGCGVNIRGVTKDLVFESNIIRDTRQGDERVQQHAISIGDGVIGLRLTDNVIEGHPQQAIVDEANSDSNELQKI